MNILVCLKEIVDSTINLGTGLRNEVLLREGLPLTLNPNDAGALAMALAFRSPYNELPMEITVVSIGPERVESYLRNGLALGADRAVRIWEKGFESLSSYQKAILLSAVVNLFGADLVITGCQSLDTANGQVGPLLAARLDFPCVIDTVRFELEEDQQHILVTRDIGRGSREKLQCTLPAVLAVKGEGKIPYASLDRLVESRYSDVTLLSPGDLGISPAEFDNDPTTVTDLVYPRPRPKKVATPDSSLPAFYRILKLLEGGISGRKGLMLEGSRDELADQLFKLLLAEGVIKSAVDS